MKLTDIKIKPEGWIESLVIELGEHRCGSEVSGLGIYVTHHGKEDAGGVLKREDMKKLIEIFTDQLNRFPLDNVEH